MSVEFNKQELKSIFRRRKGIFLTSFLLIFLTSATVAFLLPPVYKSTIMIVVENQEIPEEYVRSTVTSYVSERLELLHRKIMSYSKLLGLIRQHNLYPNLTSESDMVQTMRKAIALETIDVSLSDRRSRLNTSATIAFTLSYEHKRPHKAQEITNVLANFFLEEDQRSRETQASTTTSFIEKELESLRLQVQLNEEKISRFKAANINQLPGSMPIFSQTIFRLEQDINNIDSRIRTTQEKIVYLKSQIANIDPLVPILTEQGKVAANPANRLKYLRLQLIQMQANLSDRHPDIIKLRSEIKELEAQVGESDTSVENANRLSLLENDIAEARSKYGDRHPDVVRLIREADFLRQKIGERGTDGIRSSSAGEMSDNPGYMNIKAQIIVAESEINGMKDQLKILVEQLSDYQKRLEAAPFVEEEYNKLTLDYENARRKFNEVSNKLHTARISQEMDLTERGQRFRIEGQAYLPDKPHKPNRPIIVLLGALLGFGIAAGLTALKEAMDTSVKAAQELENIFGVPVLATVSFFESPKQKKIRRSKQLIMVATAMVILVVASVIIHRFVMPIGDLWDKFENRLVEIGVPIDKKS